jgi:hypothetical protein
MGTDIHIAAEHFIDGKWHLAYVDLPEYRNYWAFAVLADVRNGYGFAGISKGDPVTPISLPRGLPDDLSQELRAPPDTDDEDYSSKRIWLGNHSFSWVTLKELLDYDLDAPMTLRGMVSPESARKYRETGEPPHSSVGWTSKPGFERLEWQEPIRDHASLIVDLIDSLGDLGDPEYVRIVFGFDD